MTNKRLEFARSVRDNGKRFNERFFLVTKRAFTSDYAIIAALKSAKQKGSM